MANRTGKKSKKPLQTTLGKAACPNEKDVDLSHIQKPINTSIFGLRQVLSLFQTATKEVQHYITYECDIMYECRICRTIFRSLANFILHKRDYCRDQFKHLNITANNEDSSENSLENSEDILNEVSTSLSSDITESSNAGTKKGLLPVIERLKERQEMCQLAQEVLNQDLSSKEVTEDSNELCGKNKSNDLLLEEIATNNAAVFQTVLQNLSRTDFKKPEFMKSEVMEIHGILDSDEVVLGPDGKICTFETNKINQNARVPKKELFCPECNIKFATKKTLTYHIKYKHNNTRIVYVCPDCKDTFANAWCVYRHLYKVHRKTSAQIKRLRDQIHSSCVRKDQEPVKKKKNTEKVEKPDEENQWLDNIEGDNDFQMCGGCGKRFERKAALHSHAQMCTKRIAVCNTIKENNAKKKEEEQCKDLKNKSTKVEKVEVLKGSSKRKPYLLRTYKSNEENSREDGKALPNEENENCDVNANCEMVENNCDNKKEITDENNEEKKRAVRNSISSSEDALSPSKKDFVSSPSIEKIDTEKMLNIIGITTTFEHIKNTDKSSIQTTEIEGSSNSGQEKDIDNERNSSSGQNKDTDNEPNFSSGQDKDTDSERYFSSGQNKDTDNETNSSSGQDKDTDSERNSDSDQDISKPNGRSHTASDFDLFCQSVSQSLLTDVLDDKSIEMEDSPQKIPKTIPLILRRRKNSSRCEKRNSILDSNSEKNVRMELLEESQTRTDTKDHVEDENIAQISESIVLNKASSSSFKISVKSLEDLIGVSPQNHVRNSENQEASQTPDTETDGDAQIKSNELNHQQLQTSSNFAVNNEISDFIQLNTSFQKSREKYRKCLKRKRTSSFDFSVCNKFSRLSRDIFFSKKQDISFIGRASPFMDQNKLLCKPCQTTYPTLSKLLWHMSAHFSWFRFQCSRCSFISFNKLDCTNHARKMHHIRKASIQSVVLPIPNWKTVLMSHDFCLLNDENDLSGRHTDEILSGNLEEANIIEDSSDKSQNDDCKESDETSPLFAESQNLDFEPETDPLQPDIPASFSTGVKQETIDIIDDNDESFQIEVPQEIYTLDISEIIEGGNYEERYHYEPHIKTEQVDDDDDEDDSSLSNYFTTHQENEMFVDQVKIKTEVVDEETNETLFDEGKEEDNNLENQECLKKQSEQSINVRPTRNRTRSIKTIQDDFFYDLSKVIKLNDTSVSKSNQLKQKKSASQKNKDSGSSHDKNDNQKIRVYSKRK